MKKSRLRMSSLSHKYFIALAGAFLMLFLISHLATNLLLISGREIFDQAVNFLLGNPFIKVMEYVLFTAFIVHIIIGAVLAWKNNKARPVQYEVKPKSGTFTFSRYMFHTGVIIFIFLVIHLINFFFIKLGWVRVPEHAESELDFYSMAVVLFSNPYYSALYIISFLFLGFHLYHAFQSAFQSLGINHSKYTPAIKTIGLLYSLVISIGFSVIPVYFLFFHQ